MIKAILGRGRNEAVMATRRGAGAGLILLALFPFSGAMGAIPSTLFDDAKCTAFGDGAAEAPLDFVLCDDGFPPANVGGTAPNAACETANDPNCKTVTVPAKYEDPGGNTFSGLPTKKTPAPTGVGADANGDIALDVDISIPRSPPPAGGYPLLFFMHGCCSGNKFSWESGNPNHPTASERGPPTFDQGGERWHYSNAWFASRGYVVVTYTARGFVNGQNSSPANAGSTGQTEIDSRSFEINDFQHLACQVLANAGSWTGKKGAGGGDAVVINPDKVFMTGGSYGGGFSWMGLTDPVWTCTADTGASGQRMKLAAVAPKYGWTDLLHSLVPTGRHLQARSATQPDIDGCDSGPRKVNGDLCADDPMKPSTPAGVPKKSIDAALYAAGKTGVPPGSNHTTFPGKIDDAIACLESSYPVENSAACAMGANGTRPLADTLPEFMRERSAYYQADFFANIADANPTHADYRVPIFNAATLTDPLFPPSEDRRMHNRLLAVVPGYPLQAHFADHQHFVQNKAKDWADVCGFPRHACNNDDYRQPDGSYDFDVPPKQLRRVGISARLNRFFDFYAEPVSNPDQPPPSFDVTATLQVCPAVATDLGAPSDESADIFTAPTFEELANAVFTFSDDSDKGTTPTANDPFSAEADPVADEANAQTGDPKGCLTREAGATAPTGAVATYNSAALTSDVIMVGGATITIGFTTTDQTNPVTEVNNLQLNARLFDVVLPGGNAILIDRGPRRVAPNEVVGGAGTVAFQLHGNAYRFLAGHIIRLEILQDDDPYLKRSDAGGGATITSVQVSIPRRIPANRSGTVVVRPVSSSATAGSPDIAAADFTLYDNGDQGHEVSKLTIGVENPELLAELTLSVDGQDVTVTGPSASNEFTLPTSVKVRPGGRLNFEIKADLAAPASAALGNAFTNRAYAAGTQAGYASGVAGGLTLLVALLLWRTRLRRAGTILMLASLSLLSCSSDDAPPTVVPGPPPVMDNQARLTLTAVEGTADDGLAPAYQALPTILGTITSN